MVTSAINETVTLLKERFLRLLTVQATARGDVRLLKVRATAREVVPVKEEKGLWLAYQSAGNSTCGRAHGPTSVLWVFSFE